LGAAIARDVVSVRTARRIANGARDRKREEFVYVIGFRSWSVFLKTGSTDDALASSATCLLILLLTTY
jgi:hypothetical protein